MSIEASTRQLGFSFILSHVMMHFDHFRVMRVPLDPKLQEEPITKKNTNFLTSGINCGHNEGETKPFPSKTAQ
jgi:hypothetical protein